MAVMKLDFGSGNKDSALFGATRPTLLEDANPDTGIERFLAHWHSIAGDGLNRALIRLLHLDGSEVVPEGFVVDKRRVTNTTRFPEHVSALLWARIDSKDSQNFAPGMPSNNPP